MMYRNFVLIIFSIINITLFAQNLSQVDATKITSDQISDDQLGSMIQKAEASGMTEADVLSAAQAKGMQAAEIEKLRERVEKLKTKSTTNAPKDAATADRSREYKAEPAESNNFESIVDVEEEFNINNSKIFGNSIFNQKKLSFSPNLNIPTPKDYVLGPGDEIIIDIWGASQQTYQQKLSPEGSLNITNLGPIYLNGLTFDEANIRVKKEFTKIYSGLSDSQRTTFLKMSIGSTIKSIKINVVGDVFIPGTYTISSLSSVFNALYAAKGISENGTFRSIKIIRGKKIIADLDFYDYLLKGEFPTNIRLEDQDVIFVSTYTNRVSVSGEVKRPLIFDVKKSEKLKDVISFAGGFTNHAYTNMISIIRKNSKEHKVLSVSKEQIDTLSLQNGDEIIVGSILTTFENKIEIAGCISRPGFYALDEAKTLKTLIKKAEGLRADAFKNRVLVFRYRPDLVREVIPIDLVKLFDSGDDFSLQKFDYVTISSIFDLQEKYTFQIEGEVKKPGIFEYNENTTIEDLIFQAGGLNDAASYSYIEVARRIKDNLATNSSDKKAEIFKFPVSKDLKLDGTASNFVLQPFDQVFVRRSPGYQVQNVIRIEGEVAFPGTYAITNQFERVSDVLSRCGGFKAGAFIKGAKLIRYISVDNQSRNEILLKLQSQAPDSIKFDANTKNQLTVIIDLEKIMNDPKGKYDILLQDGDRLIVPREMETVRLTGAVTNPVMVKFENGKNFKSYIRNAGGFSQDADFSYSYIIYPNGEVRQTKSFLGIRKYPKVMPGSEILVPLKSDKKRFTTLELVTIGSAIGNFTLLAITVYNSIKNNK